ncbi:hypothetical protein GUJ93_ZPchr0013g37585 [Zizania palustris]|uniref:SET domain-containing protein n=1 Tax=Zizania palustris TaxID=103762 RepID=A0A8J6C2P9_ZIZPA|nr:hypothetical protein GUJ93_ZPchr0013g37585 [Zizania palustris]
MSSWEEQLRDELAGRGVAVSSVPGKGRALIATRSFSPGNPTPRLSPAIPSSGTDNYNLVDALESHISEVNKYQKEIHAQMANVVQMILPSLELDHNAITHTFSKFSCNAFTICDPQLKPVGTGLCLVISTINHSCAPNAIVIFEGRTAYLRAVQPIANNEEVLISYIDTAAPTVKRQYYLKPYYFSCTCPRCEKDSEEDALLEGYRCKDQKCDGILLPNSDYSEAASMYKIVEEQERKLYHTLSTFLLRTWNALSKIHIELKDFQTALKYNRLTIQVYERVYPPFAPLIGLQLYTRGKLQWSLGYIQDALKSLTRAADVLRVTHGTTSEFMKELLCMLKECKRSLLWR